MFGMSEYLTIWHELEKARLADRERHQVGEISPTKGSGDKHGGWILRWTRRR